MANDDQLYREIEDTLVLVEDPEDPERFFIRSDMKYLEKSPGAGKLHNSLVEMSLKSGAKMLKKAEKAGYWTESSSRWRNR